MAIINFGPQLLYVVRAKMLSVLTVVIFLVSTKL